MKFFVNIFLVCLALATATASRGGEVVQIYFPTSVPNSKINQFFNNYLGKVADPIAYSRFEDFALAAKGSNVVITTSLFAEYNPEFRPLLYFRGSGPTFKFQKVALNKQVGKMPTKDLKVGVVSFLDTKNLNASVAKLLGSPPQRVRTVPKVEDLFPLLIFGAVDVILVNPEDLKFVVKDRPHHLVGETSEVHYPALCAKEGAEVKEIVEMLKAIPPQELMQIGFKGIGETK